MIHGVVSVITPTAGRGTLDGAIDSLYMTTCLEYPVECIVVPNGGYEWFSWEHTISDMPFWCRTIVRTKDTGAIAAWNAGLEASDGEYIVMAADDLVFHESWLTEALGCLRNLPDGIGVVGFNDLHNGECHQTHFLLHRKFIVDCMGGVLCVPIYHHFQVDSEIIARATSAGRYAYAANAIVQHDHWVNSRRPLDQWDESVRQYFQEDEELFAKRKALGFPNDFAPVITA